MYLVPLVLYIVLVAILEMTTKFHFFDYVTKGIPGADWCGWHNCSFVNFYKNFYGTISPHLIPFYLGKFNITIIFSLLYSIYIYFCLSKDKKNLALRAFIASLVLILVYSIGAQFHGGVIPPGSVYGNIFSAFFVLLAAILLSFKGRPFNIVNKFILICLIIAYSQNYIHLTYSWMNRHMKEVKQTSEEWHGSNDGKLTFPMVLTAWKNRNDKDAISQMRKEYPVKSYWLFIELKYLDRNNS